MSQFWSSADEMVDVFMTLFEQMTQDDEMMEKGKKLDQIVVYSYTDPVAKVWWDARGGKFDYGSGEPPGDPKVEMTLSGDDAHRSWSNKLNPVMAITRKKIRVKGNATGLLKLQPLLKKVAVLYNKVLDEKGMSSKKL